MRTWLTIVFGLTLLACGNVEDKTSIDAPPGTCNPNNVDTCGASCQQCTVSSDRETPTCDGTSCGFACNGGALQCTDGSCSRALWAFDSGMLDGITPRAPNGLALAVRNHNGSQALAVDVTSLAEISFRIPICISGTVDISQKMFSFSVFFEGGDPGGQQYYVQASVPSPMTGAFLKQQSIQAGVLATFTAPISASTMAGTATEATIQAGTLGAAFAGTIWVDDITIQ